MNGDEAGIRSAYSFEATLPSPRLASSWVLLPLERAGFPFPPSREGRWESRGTM